MQASTPTSVATSFIDKESLASQNRRDFLDAVSLVGKVLDETCKWQMQGSYTFESGGDKEKEREKKGEREEFGGEALSNAPRLTFPLWALKAREFCHKINSIEIHNKDYRYPKKYAQALLEIINEGDACRNHIKDMGIQQQVRWSLQEARMKVTILLNLKTLLHPNLPVTHVLT